MWHLLMNSDRYVLDMLMQMVKYVLNFDPGTEKPARDKSEHDSIHIRESDSSAKGKHSQRQKSDVLMKERTRSCSGDKEEQLGIDDDSDGICQDDEKEKNMDDKNAS